MCVLDLNKYAREVQFNHPERSLQVRKANLTRRLMDIERSIKSNSMLEVSCQIRRRA